MSIGSNLIAARKAKGFTQEQLAERLGVSFQAVSAWERDAYLPETGKLAALASALNISGRPSAVRGTARLEAGKP